MKPVRYTTTAEAHAYMRMRQAQNLATCVKNANENWMRDKLAATGLTWTRQSQRGYRLFDFWSHEKGVAVEVDGLEHDESYDSYRDEYNFRRSAIIVLHVKNRDEGDAEKALELIAIIGNWKDRRHELGLDLSGKKVRRWMASQDKKLTFLGDYISDLRDGKAADFRTRKLNALSELNSLFNSL